MLARLGLLRSRPRQRVFAYIDSAGMCQAFRCSAQAPLGLGWVEVSEQHLSWLNKPLPIQARLPTVAPRVTERQALAV